MIPMHNFSKKWEKVWYEVTTCSKSCNKKRKKRKEKNRQSNRSATTYIPDESASTNQEVVTDAQYTDASSSEALLQMTTIHRVDVLSDDMIALQLADYTETLLSDEDNQSTSSDQQADTILDAKQQRKLEKKRKKAERRAQREGRGDPSAGQKQCTICNKSVNLLIRCQYDKSGQWGMVCGKCWQDVSGGVVDGDKNHPYYRYGGLWKNRRAQT